MEQEVTFKSNGLQLAGTLRLPDSSETLAIVLLVAGSGQVDRDENHKKMRINALSEIAEFLEKCRIATLRYDKRGVGESDGNYWETGFYDNVLDASSALAYVKSNPKISDKPIFVLGHSEGALICTRLAAEHSDLAGAILVAGSAQTGEVTILWQAREVAKGLRGFNGLIIRVFHIDVAKAQDKALRKIKQSSKDWLRQALVRKLNAKWFREFLAYDPAADFTNIKVPVLAVTGSKDIQVNPADLKRMSELFKSDFEYHEIPGMSHLLRQAEGEPSISDYKRQVKNQLDPRLLQHVASWLESRIANQWE